MLNFTFLDKVIMQLDNVIRPRLPARENPATHVEQQHLTTQQQSIAMMRVNHSGEVCAQALYYGQAFMAKSPAQYTALMQAASEENDHLCWCDQRLGELQGKPSLLNPVWYASSFGIGMLAAATDDKLSLGFLAETEYQVTAHLERHLRAISPQDHKSRAILQQMRDDELQHATQATQAGARELPMGIKFLMRCAAKVLTFTAAKI